ncbi:unnamed protein product [Pleuronectes platessa]|uniref:Uncharacterized protein n=1 Tax=Pleuronectes platessa TaxID=8262 RepID=A0A9N7TNA4_PLEPL|nr:unnamed protein product [Pleuronectes platessa]
MCWILEALPGAGWSSITREAGQTHRQFSVLIFHCGGGERGELRGKRRIKSRTNNILISSISSVADGFPLPPLIPRGTPSSSSPDPPITMLDRLCTNPAAQQPPRVPVSAVARCCEDDMELYFSLSLHLLWSSSPPLSLLHPFSFLSSLLQLPLGSQSRWFSTNTLTRLPAKHNMASTAQEHVHSEHVANGSNGNWHWFHCCS